MLLAVDPVDLGALGVGTDPLEERANVASPEETDSFTFTLEQGGRVTVKATAKGSGLDPLLSLFVVFNEPSDELTDTLSYKLLVQSDDAPTDALDAPTDAPDAPTDAPTDALDAPKFDASIAQHLPKGTYRVDVSAAPGTFDSAAPQDYKLSVILEPAAPPFDDVDVLGRPRAVVSDDFNGDGDNDLAVASVETGEVTIMLGLGDGAFEKIDETVAVGNGPESLVVGQFNSDDFSDLAVSNRGSDNVSILLGDGTGHFTEVVDRVRPSVGDEPQTIVSGDFNGDGVADLATANRASDDVTVLFGESDGHFGSAITKSIGHSARGLAVGYFNDDDDLDLAATSRDPDIVSILLNDSNGNFENASESRQFDVAGGAWNLVAVQLNDDDHVDLAVVSDDDKSVTILLGDGDGYFQQYLDPIPVKLDAESIATGDLDEDGFVDLLIANEDTDDVAILFGNGDGSFRPLTTVGVGDEPQTMVVAHFNSDRHLDLAVPNRGSDDVSVLLGRGDGTFLEDPRHLVGADAESIVTAEFNGDWLDFNGDGLQDIATANRVGNSVSVLLGLGNRQFEDTLSFDVGVGPAAIAAGDINGDGRADLVTANYVSSTVSLLLGLGDGTFRDELSYQVGRAPTSVVIGYENGDNLPDVVTAHRDSDALSILHGTGNLEEILSLEDEPADPLDAELAARLAEASGLTDSELTEGRFSPYAVYTSDLNGDSTDDLVTINNQVREISVRLGLKTDDSRELRFGPELRFETEKNPTSLAVADFNGDAFPDIVIGHNDDKIRTDDDTFVGFATMLLGRGDGTFDPWKGDPLILGENPTSIVAVDLNRDGLPDVVATNRHSHDVSICLAVTNGKNEFAGFESFSQDVVTNPSDPKPSDPRPGPVAIVTGDFDDDNAIDLAVANNESGTVSIFWGSEEFDSSEDAEGSRFLEQTRYVVGGDPRFIIAADFDNDRDLDLATSHHDMGAVSILWNEGVRTFETAPPLTAEDIPDPQDGVWDGEHWHPLSLAAGHFDDNGGDDKYLDLAIADRVDDTIVVLFNPGSPSPPVTSTADVFGGNGSGIDRPHSLATGHVDGDGDPGYDYLAVANRHLQNILLLRQDGDSLTKGPAIGLGALPEATAIGDFDGDGVTEQAIVRLDDVVDIVPSGSDPLPIVSERLGGSPLFGTFVGEDSYTDVVVLARNGEIYVRQGTNGSAEDTFGERMVVTAEAVDTAGKSKVVNVEADDVAIVRNETGVWLAALEPQLTFHQFPTSPDAGTPTTDWTGNGSRIASGLLNDDNRSDVVVLNADKGTVTVLLQDKTGHFTESPSVSVGYGPEDLNLDDVDDDGWIDVVVTNRISGDVSVLMNDGDGNLKEQLRVRVSVGLYGLTEDKRSVYSREESSGAAVADFDRFRTPDSDDDDSFDLAVTNSGKNSFSILWGKPSGGFADPHPSATFSTGNRPTVIRAADFDRDENTDLAILNEEDGTIWVFLGDGLGGFRKRGSVYVGGTTVGFDAFDVDRDGWIDLVAGNQFGDLLVAGNQFGDLLNAAGVDDGQLEPFVLTTRFGTVGMPVGNTIPVALGDLDGDRRMDVVLGDRIRDALTAFITGREELDFRRDRGQDAQLSPSAIELANVVGEPNGVDGREGGVDDLIVVSSATNHVLIYPGKKDGPTDAPFFDFDDPVVISTGGNEPVDVTVIDYDGDGLLDLIVTNKGSNRLTVFLAEADTDGNSTFGLSTDGPDYSLSVYADHPLSIEIRNGNEWFVTAQSSIGVLRRVGDGLTVDRTIGLPEPGADQGAVFIDDVGFVLLGSGQIARFGVYDSHAVVLSGMSEAVSLATFENGEREDLIATTATGPVPELLVQTGGNRLVSFVPESWESQSSSGLAAMDVAGADVAVSFRLGDNSAAHAVYHLGNAVLEQFNIVQGLLSGDLSYSVMAGLLWSLPSPRDDQPSQERNWDFSPDGYRSALADITIFLDEALDGLIGKMAAGVDLIFSSAYRLMIHRVLVPALATVNEAVGSEISLDEVFAMAGRGVDLAQVALPGAMPLELFLRILLTDVPDESEADGEAAIPPGEHESSEVEPDRDESASSAEAIDQVMATDVATGSVPETLPPREPAVSDRVIDLLAGAVTKASRLDVDEKFRTIAVPLNQGETFGPPVPEPQRDDRAHRWPHARLDDEPQGQLEDTTVQSGHVWRIVAAISTAGALATGLVWRRRKHRNRSGRCGRCGW